MNSFADFLIVVALPLAVAAVLIVLLLGLLALNKPGEEARARSNKLMRWRVGTQVFAIFLIMLIVVLKQTG